MNPSRLRLPSSWWAIPLGACSLAGVVSLLATSAPNVQPPVKDGPRPNPHRDDPWVLPTGEPALPMGDAAAPVRRHCALCHSYDYIATQPRLGRSGWAASVEKMRAKYGAPIPTNDVPALVNYLVKHHGKE
jgi:hypothetical protein